ncbi:MAG: NIPSNAP family protein [Pseudonocardiaceae bacterium]
MSDTATWLLEMRLFKVHPGTRAEFDRISREGTIPMMRRYGINVIAFGPSLNNDDGYFLLRAFPSEQERVRQSQAIYATAEWEANYEGPVMSMIDDYWTSVMPTASHLITQLV